MTSLRIAVIGGGHLGRIHAKLIKSIPRYELVAVADPSQQARSLVESQLQCKTVSDFRVLTGQVDAVVIATPTSLHFSTTDWALKHGIHSFVEKPLVDNSHDASRLTKLAREQGCVLQVGHVERFNPAWVAASPHVENARLIDSVRESTYTGRSTDIGVVFDLMIHDLDLILNAVPSPLHSITASGWSVLGQHEDIASAHLIFENGCIANVRASRVSRNALRKMQILSHHAMLDIDFAAGKTDVVQTSYEVQTKRFQADLLPTDERLRVKDELFTRWLPHSVLSVGPVNAIEEELKDFQKAIRTGSSPVVCGDQGSSVVALAERILQQIRANQKSEGHFKRHSTTPAEPFRRAA